VITEHQKKKGRFIIATPKAITLMEGDSEKMVIEVPSFIQNYPRSDWAPHLSLAAAIGAAWALGIPFNIIKAGVETFMPDVTTSSGV
jgi:cyanophycin synthetase